VTAAEALPMESEVSLRPAHAADTAFVVDSWLKSFRSSSGDVPGPIYWRSHREVVDALLQRANVLVACNPEDASQIFGWAAFEKRAGVLVLHYLYVKEPFRRYGIATRLLRTLSAKGCQYTHHTKAFARMARTWRAHFNPYLR
jgi:ribosomal protein S18 acetylase RimI-like enzyme